MEWHGRVELVYRVFLRHHRDVDALVEETKAKISGRWEIVCGAERTFNWPMKPEDVERHEAAGYFVSHPEGEPHLVIREVLITIHDDDPQPIADEIVASMPGTFAVVRAVRESSTEVQAV